MARGKRTQDTAILEMALIGYQAQKDTIESKIREIQAQLGGRRVAVSAGSAPKTGGKRFMSAAGRARIAAAQKKRWAEHRKRLAAAAKAGA